MNRNDMLREAFGGGSSLDDYTRGVASALNSNWRAFSLGGKALQFQQERAFNDEMQDLTKGRGVNPFLSQAISTAGNLAGSFFGGGSSSGSSSSSFRMAGDALAPTLGQQGINVPDYSSVFR